MLVRCVEELENIFSELESYGDWDARWELLGSQLTVWSVVEVVGAQVQGMGEGRRRRSPSCLDSRHSYGMLWLWASRAGYNGGGRWAERRESKEPERMGRWDKRKAERGLAKIDGSWSHRRSQRRRAREAVAAV